MGFEKNEIYEPLLYMVCTMCIFYYIKYIIFIKPTQSFMGGVHLYSFMLFCDIFNLTYKYKDQLRTQDFFKGGIIIYMN